MDGLWAAVIVFVAILGTAPVWRTLPPNPWFGPPARNLYAGLYSIAATVGWFCLFWYQDRSLPAFLLGGIYAGLTFVSLLAFFSPRTDRPSPPRPKRK